MTNTPPARDITRTTLSVLFIGILIAANYWILKPFLPSFVWAVTIVVATWPLMLRLQALAGWQTRFCRGGHDDGASAFVHRAVHSCHRDPLE